MKSSNNTVSLDSFLSFFPELPLPVLLSESVQLDFSRNNPPLPGLAIEQYLLPLEKGPVDEMTEFVPCFKIGATHSFHAIVYWRAALMDYQYILLTLTEKGALIDRRVIAGTFSDGKVLTQSVAQIDEDWAIQVVSGQSADDFYSADTSTMFQLELLPDGKIINVSP